MQNTNFVSKQFWWVINQVFPEAYCIEFWHSTKILFFTGYITYRRKLNTKIN